MNRKVNPYWVVVIVAVLSFPLSVEAAVTYNSLALSLYATIHGFFAFSFLLSALFGGDDFFLGENEEVRLLKEEVRALNKENNCLLELIVSEGKEKP